MRTLEGSVEQPTQGYECYRGEKYMCSIWSVSGVIHVSVLNRIRNEGIRQKYEKRDILMEGVDEWFSSG